MIQLFKAIKKFLLIKIFDDEKEQLAPIYDPWHEDSGMSEKKKTRKRAARKKKASPMATYKRTRKTSKALA